MSNGNGHHWSKFCWRDWRSDGALHPCGLAAKGFWIEMLCLMHEGEPVGHLTVGGKPATLRQMAANAYCTEKEAAKYLAELEEAGVFSRADDGTIYCRRMVKDAAASEQGKAWGKTGGNPALKPKANGAHPTSGGITPPLTQPITQPITPRLIAPHKSGVKLESESELELEKEPSRSPPTGRAGTPAEPGTPPTRRRDDGSNPRAVGTNPRANGTNPRAAAKREGYVSGGIAVLAERLIQIATARQQSHDDVDLTDERSYFQGLKVVEGGRG